MSGNGGLTFGPLLVVWQSFGLADHTLAGVDRTVSNLSKRPSGEADGFMLACSFLAEVNIPPDFDLRHDRFGLCLPAVGDFIFGVKPIGLRWKTKVST